jgi:hypothetical protein
MGQSDRLAAFEAGFPRHRFELSRVVIWHREPALSDAAVAERSCKHIGK